MQRTLHRCPCCSDPLWIHSDMWGPYYVCDGCGWTAEDDDSLKASKLTPPPPAFLTPEATPLRRHVGAGL